VNQEVDTESSEGVWPNPIRQFFWDFLPKSKAPENSGIRLPQYEAAEWMTDGLYRRDEVLDLARREQAEAESRAKHAEEKAHRLMQTSLALLTLALANAGFQLSTSEISRRAGLSICGCSRQRSLSVTSLSRGSKDWRLSG
jgi:hypothetical protein